MKKNARREYSDFMQDIAQDAFETNGVCRHTAERHLYLSLCDTDWIRIAGFDGIPNLFRDALAEYDWVVYCGTVVLCDAPDFDMQDDDEREET